MTIEIIQQCLSARRHLVHKAVEPEKLSTTVLNKVNEQLENNQRFWSIKFDGVFSQVIKQGNTATAFSRSGEPQLSVQHIEQEILGLPDGVYFGELWTPACSHSAINGASRTHTQQPWLQFHINDCVSIPDFLAGQSTDTFIQRTASLENNMTSLCSDSLYFVWQYAQKPHVEKYLKDWKSFKGVLFAIDGFIHRSDSVWTAGAGLGGELVKDKNNISLDLPITGMVEGKGKNKGTLGALLVSLDGVIIPVRGRISNELANIWWNNPEIVVGKIARVDALGYSSNGKLREPRLIDVVHHKLPADMETT